jgi:hypothetical protein
MSYIQAIEIPANRMLNIEVPCEIPVGPVIITFTPANSEAVKKQEFGQIKERLNNG